MRSLMLILTAALSLFAGSSAHACVDATSHPLVTVDHFDPFAGTGAVRNFTLTVTKRSHISGPLYVQFVDRDGAGPGSYLIDQKVGPYTIVDASGHKVVVSPGDARPPTSTGIGSAWMALQFSGHGESDSESFQLQIAPGSVAAGLYDKTLDLRIACRSQSGGYDYVTLPSVAEIHVAVDDLIRLVGSHNPSIDLGDLPVSGPAAHGMVLVGLRTSGAFDVSVKSQSGEAAGAHSGLLLRKDSRGIADADKIPYQISLNGVALNAAQANVRCAGDINDLNVGALTDASPGNGKSAGDFHDVIEVTLTPNFYGTSVASGTCAKR